MTKTIEIEKKLNFTPHPNTIFATKVEKNKTDSGIILPEGSESKTPIVKIRSMGKNVVDDFKKSDFDLTEGDYIYIKPEYMGFVEIDGVDGVTFMADAILGKIPRK